MTQDIILNIRKREELLNNFKKNNDTDYYESYSKLRYKVQRDFKSAKQQYIFNKLEDNQKQFLKALGKPEGGWRGACPTWIKRVLLSWIQTSIC